MYLNDKIFQTESYLRELRTKKDKALSGLQWINETRKQSTGDMCNRQYWTQCLSDWGERWSIVHLTAILIYRKQFYLTFT